MTDKPQNATERLLREAIGNHLSYWYDLDARIAEHVLTVRIPQACQTCKERL
jgi:hypothetical protein